MKNAWKHGQTNTRLHQVWRQMKARCANKSNKDFPSYGGRGIQVCPRWRDSFVDFLADMGPRPSPHHSIDRINNDGNYEPGNCRWATQSEQNRNRRKQTHCWRGHEFTPENTYQRGEGGRHCRACNRLAVAALKQRRAAA